MHFFTDLRWFKNERWRETKRTWVESTKSKNGDNWRTGGLGLWKWDFFFAFKYLWPRSVMGPPQVMSNDFLESHEFEPGWENHHDFFPNLDEKLGWSFRSLWIFEDEKYIVIIHEIRMIMIFSPNLDEKLASLSDRHGNEPGSIDMEVRSYRICWP